VFAGRSRFGVSLVTRATGAAGSGGCHPAKVRAWARAIALSVMPGNRRRSSMAADSSPPRSKAERIAAASVSETTNICRAWGALLVAGKENLTRHAGVAFMTKKSWFISLPDNPSRARVCLLNRRRGGTVTNCKAFANLPWPSGQGPLLQFLIKWADPTCRAASGACLRRHRQHARDVGVSRPALTTAVCAEQSAAP
jgi:hypothetical protein